jgi:hypothetical protein
MSNERHPFRVARLGDAAMSNARRIAFAKARTPVAVAMRVVAASVAQRELAAGVEPGARRSVFVRRATLGLAALPVLEGLAGTRCPADKDVH